jgi:hypothetical protein
MAIKGRCWTEKSEKQTGETGLGHHGDGGRSHV